MRKTINLKKRKIIGKREIIVMVLAVVLTSVGIKASDSFLEPKESDLTLSDGKCPMGMVFVNTPTGGFCIDKYEVASGDGCPYANPVNQKESRLNLDYIDCKPKSESGNLPWRFISQNQAAIACAKAGKRLPTNKEWLAAALGTPDIEKGWSKDDCNVASNWDYAPGFGGQGSKCKSAYGAYDMIGNVWEWVDGTAHNGVYEDKILPESGYVEGVDSEALPSATNLNAGDENYYYDYFWIKNKGVRGMARGGYWNNNTDAGQYALYVVSEPSFAGTGVGFRCAK